MKVAAIPETETFLVIFLLACAIVINLEFKEPCIKYTKYIAGWISGY